MKISTKVEVTVIVESGPVWGPEWKVGDVKKRAAEEARQTVRLALEEQKSLAVVGDPRVTLLVICEEGER